MKVAYNAAPKNRGSLSSSETPSTVIAPGAGARIERSSDSMEGRAFAIAAPHARANKVEVVVNFIMIRAEG